MSRMNFGISWFATDQAVQPDELAPMVEERGFESLFVTDHTHIPVSRDTPYPAGGELPPEYWRSHDPFVALAAVAGATKKLRFGTAICLLVERDPIVTAKAVASLDMISGGRMIFGVGAGWNEEEMRNHGTDPRTRFGLLRERVEACRAIWTSDQPEYHGKHVDFDPILCWPKPVQEGGVPVLLGGNGPKVLDRVLAYADEWLPNRIPPDQPMIERIAELGRRAEDADRKIGVTLQLPPRDPAVLEAYEQAGVGRVIHMLRAEDAATREGAERKLDEWADRMRAYNGA